MENPIKWAQKALTNGKEFVDEALESKAMDTIKTNFSGGVSFVTDKISEVANDVNNSSSSHITITRNENGSTSMNLAGDEFSSFRSQWIEYGSKYGDAFKSNSKFTWDWSWDGDNSFFGNIKNIFVEIGKNAKPALENMKTAGMAAAQAIGTAAFQGVKTVVADGPAAAEWIVTNMMAGEANLANSLQEMLNNVAGLGDKTVNSSVGAYLQNGLSIFANDALNTYGNGVDETSYGKLMGRSWNKGGKTSFKELINNETTSKSIVWLTSTPLDPGSNRQNLYGNMLLGAPPIFTHITDPRNRTLSETIIRDAKFLTLIPGFPQYNGANLTVAAEKGQYGLYNKPEKMIEYLLKNGIDSDIASADKRYYTFKQDYVEYFSYLETMLNTVWLRMGLGTSGDNPNVYKMFTFFKNIDDDKSLKNQYKSGIGFYVNPSGAITENLSNEKTSLGSEQASMVNAASEKYQSINYLSGMGTGGAVRNNAVKIQKSYALLGNMKSLMGNLLENTVGVWSSGQSLLKKALLTIPAVVNDVIKVSTEKDAGAIMQTFAVTNGMKIIYPELWSDSTVSRSINFNFEFTSPYGDPLSIFQYVMVPFCSLLTFAMPRQAADNGYVSPFFIRSDIPGLFTSDFGIISDFSWTRGGSNDLWTKDGLPRAISGSFSISDLYPYLAMTKRISFLSANPNYTSFLDSLSGLHAVKVSDQTADNSLNEYWKRMLSRVTGEETQPLFNTYSVGRNIAHEKFGNTIRKSNIGGNTKRNKGLTWLR